MQQFGDRRALTWSGNQESFDGGIWYMWDSGFEGTVVRNRQMAGGIYRGTEPKSCEAVRELSYMQ